MEFSKEIARMHEELMNDFLSNENQDPIQWMIEKIKEILDVDDREAQEQAKKIIEGIELYRKFREEKPSLKVISGGKLDEPEIAEVEQLSKEISLRLITEDEEDGDRKN